MKGEARGLAVLLVHATKNLWYASSGGWMGHPDAERILKTTLGSGSYLERVAQCMLVCVGRRRCKRTNSFHICGIRSLRLHGRATRRAGRRGGGAAAPVAVLQSSSLGSMDRAVAIGALVVLGWFSVVLVAKKMQQPLAFQQRIPTAKPRGQQLFARPASHFVQHSMNGEQRPKGMSFKQFFYECFKRDVARGETTENLAIPKRNAADGKLRLLSFNIHFFCKGYSFECLGSNTEEVLRIVADASPDVVLFQEVPQSELEAFKRRLAALGYPHAVAAGCADVHVLSAGSKAFPGERLHVMVASRLPLLQSAAVPMLDGHAAFAEIALDDEHKTARKSTLQQPRSVAIYSVHLSVRCEAHKRRREVEAVLRHARHAHQAPATGIPTFIVGDFNQPNECDYTPSEWAVIADDMTRAKLELSDGAMDAMRAKGFTPSWEAAAVARPLAASSAWNGAVVDYCYVSQGMATDGTSALEVESTYFLHTLASDHLPLVVDVRRRDGENIYRI